MEQKELNNKKAVLTFEGKKYVIEDLPKEVKEIIKNLQIADAQLKLHEDNLKLISIGRNSLTDNLRKRLDSLNL